MTFLFPKTKDQQIVRLCKHHLQSLILMPQLDAQSGSVQWDRGQCWLLAIWAIIQLLKATCDYEKDGGSSTLDGDVGAQVLRAGFGLAEVAQ